MLATLLTSASKDSAAPLRSADGGGGGGSVGSGVGVDVGGGGGSVGVAVGGAVVGVAVGGGGAVVGVAVGGGASVAVGFGAVVAVGAGGVSVFVGTGVDVAAVVGAVVGVSAVVGVVVGASVVVGAVVGVSVAVGASVVVGLTVVVVVGVVTVPPGSFLLQLLTPRMMPTMSRTMAEARTMATTFVFLENLFNMFITPCEKACAITNRTVDISHKLEKIKLIWLDYNIKMPDLQYLRFMLQRDFNILDLVA